MCEMLAVVRAGRSGGLMNKLLEVGGLLCQLVGGWVDVK